MRTHQWHDLHAVIVVELRAASVHHGWHDGVTQSAAVVRAVPRLAWSGTWVVVKHGGFGDSVNLSDCRRR